MGIPINNIYLNNTLILETIISDSNGNKDGNLMYKSYQVISYADYVALIARNPKNLRTLHRK